MAKIAFIKPLQELAYSYSVIPPMGIMYLSAVLKSRGHYVSFLDLQLHGSKSHLLVEWVRDQKPDILGISALSSEAPSAHRIASTLKAAFPGKPVVIGGPYPTTSSKRAMSDTNIDYCAIGEAEESFPRLVDYILSGEELPLEFPGVGFRRDGELVLGGKAPPIEDVDSIPMPDWDLINHQEYFTRARPQLLYKHRAYMPIFTSRGCPFQCAYCHKIFGRKFRPHSAERALEEIDILYKKYGIREFQVLDDIFNLDYQRAAKIATGIIDSGKRIHLNFPNGVRADRMDRELLRLLKEAGTFKINYAVETASPRVQKLIKKNVDLDKMREIIEMTDQEKILQLGFFMLGFPTEVEEEMWQTINFAKESRFHLANFFIVNVFEGTDLFDLARSAGVSIDYDSIKHDYWRPSQQISEVSPKRLEQIFKAANIQFYMNPSRLARLLYLFPNKKQIPAFAWFFLCLVLPG